MFVLPASKAIGRFDPRTGESFGRVMSFESSPRHYRKSEEKWKLSHHHSELSFSATTVVCRRVHCHPHIIIFGFFRRSLTRQSLPFPSLTCIPYSKMFSAAIYRASTLSSTVATNLASRRCFHASPLAWAKLNVQGLADKVNLEGKNVLVRVDLNVPLAKASVYKTAVMPIFITSINHRLTSFFLNFSLYRRIKYIG